jgi:translation initiation factor 5
MEQNGKLYLTSDEGVLFDTNYRYKISVIEISHLNKKGTKITILNNFDTFCRELIFDKIVLLRILGKKLSCKTGVDKTTKDYYLQGEYSVSQIKDIVYNFIQKYLLCVVCDKPEVSLKYKKNNIKQKCGACGNNDYLSNCDLDVLNILENLN